MSNKNRDGKPTEFQRKKLREFGYKGKTPATYREAEKLLARYKRQAKKAAPAKLVPAKGEAEPCKKPVAVKKAEKKPVKGNEAAPSKKTGETPKIESYVVTREDIVKFGFLLTKAVEIGFRAMMNWGQQQPTK